MSRRSFLLVIILLSLIHDLHSQEMRDVVYLNNGTFLWGTIVEQVPHKFLRIVVLEKDTLMIPMIEVKEIRKAAAPVNSDPNFEDGVRVWGHTTILGMTLGRGLREGVDRYEIKPEETTSFGVSSITGFTFSPYIQLGLGLGLEWWKHRVFVPLSLDFRTNLLKNRNTPYGYVDAGYSLGWIKHEMGADYGGAMIGLGAGARIGIGKKTGFFVSLGYLFQQTNQWQLNFGVRTKATIDAHFVAFHTGIVF